MQEFNKMAYDQETVSLWQQMTHQARMQLQQVHNQYVELQKQHEELTKEQEASAAQLEEMEGLKKQIEEMETELSDLRGKFIEYKNMRNSDMAALQEKDNVVQNLNRENTELHSRLRELDQKCLDLSCKLDLVGAVHPAPDVNAPTVQDIKRLQDVADRRDNLLQNVADDNGQALNLVMAVREMLLNAQGPLLLNAQGSFTVDGKPADKYAVEAAIREFIERALHQADSLQTTICRTSERLNAQGYGPRVPGSM